MANRVGNFLESYDFFGKSIPGIVLFMGAISMLPKSDVKPALAKPEGGVNLTAVFAVLLTLVFVGLVMGQAVHTLAVNVEKVLYWMGHTTYNFYYQYIADKIHSRFEDGKAPRKLVSLLRLDKFWAVTRWWWIRRYWGFHDIFKSHRRLFENSLGWHFDKKVKKRNGDKENILYHGFIEAFDQNFQLGPYTSLGDFGIQTEEYEEFRQIYPLVASKVTESDRNRASGFQARYSFCRGMWVVLSLVLIGYLLAFGYFPIKLEYEAIIQGYSKGIGSVPVLGVLSISILAFLDAAGDYKRYYIEYVISEFYAEYGQQEDEQEDENVYNYYYPPHRRNT